MDLEGSWRRLGSFGWGLGSIWRFLGEVLGALEGMFGALLDVLEVSWKSNVCQDLPGC